jgi:hypothetical protein
MSGKRVPKIVLVVALVIASALVSLGIVGFEEAMYPPTLCEALILLGTAVVINALLGAFIAMLLEYWPAWEGLVPKLKRPVVLGFCLVVPVLSLVARFVLCAAVIDQNEIYLAIMAGITAFTGSQFAHIYKLPTK